MTQDQVDTLSALGHFYLVHGFPERALVIFKAMNLVDKNHVHTLRSLALAYARTNNPSQAINALDQLALQGDMDGPYHLLRSQVLMRLNRNAEATASMRAYMNAIEARQKALA